MTQYDEISKEYVDYEDKNLMRNYVFGHSFMSALGNLKDKDVLDLACGSGYFTRKIKLGGAKKVVGVDISKEMIELAKDKDLKDSIDIKYITMDVIGMGKIGEFDVVSASFLLNYAKTEDELFRMCQAAYLNLKEGCSFIALTENTECPIFPYKKYGITMSKQGPLEEGCKILVRLFGKGGEEVCSFETYYWSKQTYEAALRKAGFKEISWEIPQVSKEGVEKYGKEFWKEYYQSPDMIIITAKK